MTTLVGQNTYRHNPNPGAVPTTGGNKQDLSDVISDISPTETPVVTMLRSGSASAVYHEWLTDELEAPKKNAVPEGHIAEPHVAKPRKRLGNYTQILEKTASVTGTQEKVDKAGVKSEMAYQVARRMKEIKRDLEVILVGAAPQARSAGTGDPSTPPTATKADAARLMGSFASYMVKPGAAGVPYSWFGPTTGSGLVPPTGDGTTAPVVPAPLQRVFTEDILQTALQQMWENGGTETMAAIMGANLRGAFSRFALSNSYQRNINTDSKTLTMTVDVYDGDFHTITAKPDRYCDPNTVFMIDPAFASLDDLRPIFSQDLAITGDGMNKQIIWETTLKVTNPLAHGVIDGLKAK